MLKIISVVVAFMIVSCSSSKNSDSPSPAATPAPNSQTPPGTTPITPAPQVTANLATFTSQTQGSWKTLCAPAVPADGTSETNVITIAGSNLTLTRTSYAGTSCATPKYAAKFVGTYTTGNAAVIKTGGYNVTYKFATQYLTLYDATLVSQSYWSSQCGTSSWKAGVEKQIIQNTPNCNAATQTASVMSSTYNSVIVPSNQTSISLFDLDSSPTASYVAQKQ
jgi:hypothetical protein